MKLRANGVGDGKTARTEDIFQVPSCVVSGCPPHHDLARANGTGAAGGVQVSTISNTPNAPPRRARAL